MWDSDGRQRNNLLCTNNTIFALRQVFNTENSFYFQQQATMDALAAGDAEEHEHCKTCVRMKCNVKSNWPDSCDVIDCENRCGMRLHKCKQIEHLQVKRIHLSNSN